MVHILLVCSAGMSTSLMVTKMQAEAEKQGIEAEIWAEPASEAQDNIPKADVLLLGPQVRFMKKQMEGLAGGKPVGVIDTRTYGMMDGAGVLKQALELVG